MDNFCDANRCASTKIWPFFANIYMWIMWKRFSSASAYAHYLHEPHILAITWPSLLLNIARIANVHGIYLVGAHSTIRISVITMYSYSLSWKYRTSVLSHRQLGCFILIGDIKTSLILLSCLGTAKNGQR